MASKKSEDSEDWRDIALHFAVGTMRELGNTVLRSFQDKIDRAVSSLVRRLFSTLFLCVGLVFLLVGLANLVNDLLPGSTSVGYILVGAVAIVIAMVTSFVKGGRMG